MEFETVKLDRPVDLRTLATGMDVPFVDLQALNPELRTPITPREPDGYDLRIPAGSREVMLVAFAASPTAVLPSFKTHTVKKGDTLPRIAKRYGVTVAALASANSLNPRAKVSRGQEIMVPVKVAAAPKTSKASTKKASARPVKTADAAEAKSYRVKSGDTLYRIAIRNGVTVAEILAINGLGGAPSLKAGDKISIPAKGK